MGSLGLTAARDGCEQNSEVKTKLNGP